jgi:TRAP-type C4-dicarboxylate transport system permease small subunit
VKSSLESAGWFNESPRWLRISAVAVALGFLLFCLATAYFVAQYFVCIAECKADTPPLALLAVSTFFGLIPAAGTGAIGYFILRGLWDDARQREREAALTADARDSDDGRRDDRRLAENQLPD